MVDNLNGPLRRGLKRLREAGIRTNSQRKYRKAMEIVRNPSGNIETQQNSCETIARASKSRSHLTARAVAVGNLSGPPRRGMKRPTMGISKYNGSRAKSQWERRNQGPIPPPRTTLRSATKSITLNIRTPLSKHYLENNIVTMNLIHLYYF